MRHSLTSLLALRNLRSDWFGTLCAIIGVALGTATVNVVLVLDVNTRAVESHAWGSDPDLEIDLSDTVQLKGVLANGHESRAKDLKLETHEDYQVMRSAIRLGSLSAFLVGALIVFFTFRVVVEQRRREIALLRSLGTTPRQVAAMLALEATIVGFAGAGAGFIIAPPLAMVAAALGITTTGRSTISWVWFPWRTMLVVSAIGAVTAIFGIVRPLFDVLRLDVARTLRPKFLEESRIPKRSQASGFTLIALPFMALLYVLIRPFFYEALPSLAFFVLESGLVCAAFLSMLVLIPEIVRSLGGIVGRVLPRGPVAPRLLTLRRIERLGHEFSWAVSGVMLVFALLLSLHLITRALKIEVEDWASSAIRDKAYIYTRRSSPVPAAALSPIPPNILRARFSGRTPWPNPVLAAETADLVRFAEGMGAEVEALARALGRGKVILSKMMAKRFSLAPGDYLEVESTKRTARLEVIAVSDDLGYMPMIGPYRNSKTYALISSDDFDLIQPYAAPLGAGIALRRGPEASSRAPEPPWSSLLAPLAGARGLRVEIGSNYAQDRVRETNRDFAIFDVILFLTGVLAAVGIANNLVLSAHARRREIALYRVLGMQVRQIKTLFLMEGAFIGMLGGVMAVVLGVPLGFAAIRALEVISAFSVRFDLPPSYVVVTIAGALTVSLASSFYPAARASALSGAESVHYE